MMHKKSAWRQKNKTKHWSLEC